MKIRETSVLFSWPSAIICFQLHFVNTKYVDNTPSSLDALIHLSALLSEATVPAS